MSNKPILVGDLVNQILESPLDSTSRKVVGYINGVLIFDIYRCSKNCNIIYKCNAYYKVIVEDIITEDDIDVYKMKCVL